MPSDELTTLLSILLSHGASRRLIRRVVYDTWRERGTLVDAAARLKADFGVDPPTARCVGDERRVLDRLGVVVVRGDSAEFSALLASAPDPPIALFVKGRASSLTQPLSVAVVGSRRASPPGRGFARTLAADLGRAGAVIVSGLAIGIDGSAHRGALDVGSLTVAVIGGGHARIYPSSHRDLASEIAMAGGAVVSEYPPSAAPRRANFPERNRIISGLCAGVVVVEATNRSGTLITARMALEQGREVMAVPGSVADGMHGGCHRLIKQGAALIESVGDVLEVFGLAASPQRELPMPPDESLSRVLAAVPNRVATLAEIVATLALPVDAVLGALVELEIEGFVEAHHGGYIRRPPS